MKKVAQLLAGATLSLSLLSGVAAAATSQDCSITGPTGPNSVNTCTNNQTNTITITCVNDTDILNINGQASFTGSASVDQNSNVGTVQTGPTSNSNFVYTDANISCAPATQASVTTGGQGGGTVAAAPAATPAPAVKSLPKTGSESKVTVAAIATGAFAGLAAVARLGSSAYRKLS